MELSKPELFQERCFVGGEWVSAESNRTIAVHNPATGELVGNASSLAREETRAAIRAAERALPGWRKLTAKERSAHLRKWFDLIMQNQDDLARIMTAEQGKPLAEARGEIAYAASYIEWFAEEGKRIYGDTIQE